ncbi:MAG: hypothetical protein JWP89_3011 [Schlesneria sp.]|nr:hypothetical protein [Schlesneria sp.]
MWHSPERYRSMFALEAERVGQLDPQSLAVQSVGVLIGSSSFVAGKLL